MKPLSNVWTLCRLAVLTALYVILTTMLTLRLPGDIRITFASLPILLSALLYGPGEAALVALVGEFLNQILGPGGYGITATTVLWCLPPAARAVIVGTAAGAFLKTGKPLERRPALCYAVCILGGVGTTVANTAVYWLDSVIYHYYTFAIVFGSFVGRLATGIVTALAVTTVAMPVAHVLRRQGFARVEVR